MSASVLVVGASGWLGTQIVDAALARGLSIRVGLRGGMSNPKARLFEGRAEIVAADLGDDTSLAEAVRGVETIVSAVQGGAAEIVDGQVALAKAGLAAGVRRMLPSDFGLDFRGVSTERNLFLGWRAEADRRIAELGLAQANIYNGTFIEVLVMPFYGMLDIEGSRVRFYGDPDQPYDFTATKDVAEFTAEVVRDRERVGPQMVVGERVSARQLAAVVSEAYGRPFALTRVGDLDQLETDLAAAQAADPDDPMSWISWQYQRMMITGEGALALPVPSRFVTEPVHIRDFLAQQIEEPSR